MVIKFVVEERARSGGKLADAELHFTDGPLAGLRLVGFAVWQRKTGPGRNVTMPARQYTMNGERRSYALLRPQSADTNMRGEHVARGGSDAPELRLRDLILDAFEQFEAGLEARS